MMFTITPATGAMVEAVSVSDFLVFNGVVTVVLVIALIMRELLSTASADDTVDNVSHHGHFVSALDIAIYPLFFIFFVTTLYRVVEVLYI